jgi:N-acetylglucosaminyl-diphospho-decaprenol L-rhamnosyltransferase
MLSVVIVAYNSASCLGSCIEALTRWYPDAETVVVDNASTDTSRAVAEGYGATVVPLSANVGFGRACNAGVQRAAGDHILFLNPDVEICSADAGRLDELFATAALGLIVPTSSNNQFIFSERSRIRETLFLTLRALRPREVPTRTPAPQTGDVVWASGAALLVRRSEFLSVGRFDPRYFLYYEDRDLSWRYRQRGLPIRANAALRAEHVGGGSSEVTGLRGDIGAFAVLGWIQYQSNVYGRDAAIRSWNLFKLVHGAVTRPVGWAARVIPSARFRRKSDQLRELAKELGRISASQGVLERSDESRYWPDAVDVVPKAE